MTRILRLPVLALVAAALLSGCSGRPAPDVSGRPTSSPGPTPGAAQLTAELKYDLIGGLGPLWYCDPDIYPIAHGEEIDHARERWPEVVADTGTFAAIAAKLEISPSGPFTDAQKLAAYQAWKVLNAIALDPAGTGAWRFDYLAQPATGATLGTRTTGTITASGAITVDRQVAAPEPMCPICLARGTLIEAPSGAVAVNLLRLGDVVWTLDGAGGRVPGSVIAVGSTPVPAGHEMIRLVLADGRSVTATPGHPLADGRRLGDLVPGDEVAGSVVVAADLVPYMGEATYDLVVAGATGTYLVDGIPLGSTLRP